MTLAQAKARFPHVPAEIVKWALDNIADPGKIEQSLTSLEQTKRVQLKYAS